MLDNGAVWLRVVDGIAAHVELDGSTGAILGVIDRDLGSGPEEEGMFLWFVDCTADMPHDLPIIGGQLDTAVTGLEANRRFALTKVEPGSRQPVGLVPTFGFCREESGAPITGGHVWSSPFGAELETGEPVALVPGQLHQVLDRDGIRLFSDSVGVGRMDGLRWTRLFEHEITFADLASSEFAEIRFRDGGYWVSGESQVSESQSEIGLAIEFDPETGEFLRSRSASELPALRFEGGGFAWELPGDGWLAPPLDEQGGDWKAVDLVTGDVAGEFDFEEFVPIGVSGETLWLLNHADGIVGRIPIAELLG